MFQSHVALKSIIPQLTNLPCARLAVHLICHRARECGLTRRYDIGTGARYWIRDNQRTLLIGTEVGNLYR
jgi:hypothetical protein